MKKKRSDFEFAEPNRYVTLWVPLLGDVYYCGTCAALVMYVDRHDMWHAQSGH